LSENPNPDGSLAQLKQKYNTTQLTFVIVKVLIGYGDKRE